MKRLASPGIRFGIFLVALTVFLLALLGLVAPLRTRLQLQAALDSTRIRRQQQEILFPFYQSLLVRDRIGDWKDLDAGTPVPLKQDQVVQVPSLLADLTSPHGYRVMDRTDYRIREGAGGKRVLQVELPMRGRYEDLGGLLGDILRFPAVDRITLLRVEELEGVQGVTIGLDLLLEP